MLNTMKKKIKSKSAKQKRVPTSKSSSQELVIRVLPQEVVPTTTDLSEPMRDGKKLTIPKTWVSEAQLTKVLQSTPKQYLYQKPGKGGGTFTYVTVSYIQKALNYIFGWNWDFEVVQHGVEGGQVWVLGKLTVRGTGPNEVIVKTQFGRADIKYKRGTKEMLDFGNDLKGATSDALKKCASMFGIASDVYGKAEYKEESGVTPRPDNQPSKEEPVVQTQEGTEICKGPEGTGCLYGNDAEPLPQEVANYSKKIYGKALCRECQKDAKKK